MQELIRNPAGYNEDSFGLPEATDTGIRCGNHPRGWDMRHENVAAVRACYVVSEQLAAEQRGEIYAEAVMSWVAGGGSPEDARTYANVIASGQDWNEYLTGSN